MECIIDTVVTEQMKKQIENIDRSFVRCLEEIMHAYVILDKQGRIRVEQWVQKLSTVLPMYENVEVTNLHLVWKKNRNLYAKFLLNMVVSGSLLAPFSNLPPAGPLQTFPHHVTKTAFVSSKSLIGPHETTFWRGIFLNINHDLKSGGHKNGKEDNASSIEVNLLVKEQAIRIDVLERQLREERTQHKMEIHKLLLQYRSEVFSGFDISERRHQIDNMSKDSSNVMIPPLKSRSIGDGNPNNSRYNSTNNESLNIDIVNVMSDWKQSNEKDDLDDTELLKIVNNNVNDRVFLRPRNDQEEENICEMRDTVVDDEIFLQYIDSFQRDIESLRL